MHTYLAKSQKLFSLFILLLNNTGTIEHINSIHSFQVYLPSVYSRMLSDILNSPFNPSRQITIFISVLYYFIDVCLDSPIYLLLFFHSFLHFRPSAWDHFLSA